MKWAIVCFSRVLAVFSRKEDADQVLLLVKKISSMPCEVCIDTRDYEESYCFKEDSSEGLIQFLTLFDRPASVIGDMLEES